MPQKLFCSYYQAYVVPQTGWFVVAALKSFDHLAFDRTVDVNGSIFEFFVPEAYEPTFLSIMKWMEENGYVRDVQKLPNRLITETIV